MHHNRTRGLSLISLIVVMAILALLAGVMAVTLWPRGEGEEGVPGPSLATQKAHRSVCLNNLVGIHRAIKMYEISEERLPVMRRRPVSNAGVNAAPTQANATDTPYDETGWEELGDQAMQNMWLLIANNNLGETAFKCPGDGEWRRRVSDAEYGWTNSNQYSYTIQWPYELDADGKTNPAPFRSRMDKDFVIAADHNPHGSAEASRHRVKRKDVVVFLRWSGTVDTFEAGDSNVGIDGDDIYTNAHGEAGGMPANEHDTSLSFSPR